MTAGPILSLRHYRHDLIAHSHEHPQLVFGLGGRLDFEVQGHEARLDRQRLMVVPAGTHHSCGSETGSHCLSAECGVTPMDYIRQRRLLKARELVIRTALPLGEIAAQVGYGSQSAFSAAMLRAFGCTPLALRRESGDNGR